MRTEAGSVQEGGGNAGHSLHNEVGVVAHDGAGDFTADESDVARVGLVEWSFEVVGETLEETLGAFVHACKGLEDGGRELVCVCVESGLFVVFALLASI